MRGRRIMMLLCATACVWLASLFIILGFVESIEEADRETQAILDRSFSTQSTVTTARTRDVSRHPVTTTHRPPTAPQSAIQVDQPERPPLALLPLQDGPGVALQRSNASLNASEAPALSLKVDAAHERTAARLTAPSECALQTFTGRGGARSSSVYSSSADELAVQRHGATLAFDADTTTAFHSACGLPSAPWYLSYRFEEPTTVSVIKLTSDAPADYPAAWELHGSLDGERFVLLLRVARDNGIASACIASLRQHRCDRPQTREYEVRNPGDFREYKLIVNSVSNHGRSERNCLQLAEVNTRILLPLKHATYLELHHGCVHRQFIGTPQLSGQLCWSMRVFHAALALGG